MEQAQRRNDVPEGPAWGNQPWRQCIAARNGGVIARDGGRAMAGARLRG